MHPVLFKAKNWLERLNPVNVFANVQLTSYSKSRNWIELTRDSDGATLDVGYSTTSKASALSWSTGTDSYISKRYSQVRGKPDITISNSSLQELAITGNAWALGTTKYALYEPYASSISVNDNTQSINSRMKNKSLAEYIVLKNNVDGVVTSRGYTADYCSFIKCSTGLMDFNITNGSNVMWYLADGTVSTATRPTKSMVAGVSHLFATNMTATNILISSNGTSTRYVGALKDFSKLRYVLNLNDTNTTGHLADLGGNLTNTLRLDNCGTIRGDLKDLGGNLTGYLNLTNCTLITGNLSDLQGKINAYLFLPNCPLIAGDLVSLQGKILEILNLSPNPLIYGVYVPATAPPTTTRVGLSGMSTSDIDNTLIAYANASVKNNGQFYAIEKNRTVLSDTAVALLISRGWTINVTRI